VLRVHDQASWGEGILERSQTLKKNFRIAGSAPPTDILLYVLTYSRRWCSTETVRCHMQDRGSLTGRCCRSVRQQPELGNHSCSIPHCFPEQDDQAAEHLHDGIIQDTMFITLVVSAPYSEQIPNGTRAMAEHTTTTLFYKVGYGL
jgi:hypothetical protein